MIIVKTPLRISFLGGGTDFPEYFQYNGGAVLGTSINKYIYHSISNFPSGLFDHNIRISYKKVEHVNDLNDIEHSPFREILNYCNINKDIEINLASDLPSFSGLGSSSSFTVGLLKGLYAYKGNFISQFNLAKTAIKLEREILKESVGFQDQIFASYGGINLIRFFDKSNFNVERIIISHKTMAQLEKNLVLIFTGQIRKANEIEKEKMSNIKNINNKLDQIHSLVFEGLDCLSNNRNLDYFGKLLHENWMLKKDLTTSVSNDLINQFYNFGLKSGALGGKLLGAGGGGFILFYVPFKNQRRFREAFSKYYEVKFKINSTGSTIVHS